MALLRLLTRVMDLSSSQRRALARRAVFAGILFGGAPPLGIVVSGGNPDLAWIGAIVLVPLVAVVARLVYGRRARLGNWSAIPFKFLGGPRT